MSEKKYRVYRYTNIVNGMKYLGSTSYKYQSHRAGKDGKNYIKMCRRFGEAILEYGWPNFKYEVLEDSLTKEEAEVREKYWIEKENSIWPNGYNLEAGGKDGHSVNDDTKRKMSENRKGISLPCTFDQSKPIQQFTKDGHFVKEYPSLSEASRQTGILNTSICNNLKGRSKSSGNSIWRYAS